jgi:hypothetical protein
MDNVKAIKLNDKIIIFINGKRQVITKLTSPETFESISQLIKLGEVDKIRNIFTNFESNVTDFIKEYFIIKDKKIFLKEEYDKKKLELNILKRKLRLLIPKNDNSKRYSIQSLYLDNKPKPHLFSKLLIRKISEFISLNETNILPLYKFSKKINLLKLKSISVINYENFFKELTDIKVTLEGNLIIPLRQISIDETKFNKVFGSPININKDKENSFKFIHSNSLSLSILSNEYLENGYEVKCYALINPFDITSFSKNELHITRYKLIKNIEKEKTLIEIKNEFLYDISYNIAINNI